VFPRVDLGLELLELVAKIERGLVAAVRVLGQAAADDAAQVARQ
jgi:hypothetical protein